MVNEMFNGLFGRIDYGMCRLSMNGDIAIHTSNGYKTYNVKKGTLVNCNNFVFDIGEEFFFVIPSNKVEKGDIILVGGRPKCVIEAEKNKITAIDYESSEIKTIIPERHIFMGNVYFYGKIVSMFGNTNFIKGKKGTNKIMQIMLMQEMMKGMTGGNGKFLPYSNNGEETTRNGGMASMLPMIFMMNGGAGNMFDGMFDFDFDEDEEDEKPEVESEDEE